MERVPQAAEATPPLKSLGWASLALGAMLGLGVALWNRMSALNRSTVAGGDAVDGRAGVVAAAATALALNYSAFPAAAEFRLPPLDTDPKRCERAFVGNTIGQANGVSDRALDLRQCQLAGKSLDSMTLSGALMADGDFHDASLVEAVLSKVYAVGANFAGANFSSAVLDRGTFDGADMTDANFYNAVITGATFKDTNLTGSRFEDALIGSEDAKRLCANPTLVGDARDDVGCRS